MQTKEFAKYINAAVLICYEVDGDSFKNQMQSQQSYQSA